MAKSDYVRTNEGAFASQLESFRNNIAAYATVLGLTPAQVSAEAADADYYRYVLNSNSTMQQGAQQWSSWRNLVRRGGTPPSSGAPVAPVLGVAVPAVALGIEVRFRALVKQIKANANYNPAIGEALGIEGPEQSGPDLTTIQPNIEAKISGTSVTIAWGWSGHSDALDMIEIQVDRGAGQGFVFLTNDTTPGYVDTTPFPATPAKWTYKAIYRVNDQQVGQWSKPVSVTVGG